MGDSLIQGGIGMDQQFGIKDLNNVSIKAVTPFSFGSRSVEAGEPVLYFTNVQISQFDQSATPVTARGGRGNQTHVIWERKNDMIFQLTAGVLTNFGFGLLTNATVLDVGVNDTTLIPKTEILALDSAGQGILESTPSARKPIFCFLYKNQIIQEKMTYSLATKTLSFGVGHSGDNVLVEYYYEYGQAATLYILDKNRFNGTFSLEGKITLKGDTDGLEHTELVTIPRMKIMTSLNLRLGELATPVVSTFNIVAIPTRTSYSDSSVIEFIELQENIL